jgi:molybdopterin converting factor subunit 1
VGPNGAEWEPHDILFAGMQIHVRYFAVVKERLRSDGETLEVPANIDVRRAVDLLAERHADLGPLRKHIQVAVNMEMVPLSQTLRDGDELALIPPVAGGARLAIIVPDRPPSLDHVVDAVRAPAIGGIVAFVGLVRASSQGRSVEKLDYEAYAAMAEKVFHEICDEIEARHVGVALAIEHRVGALRVGDVAVALAAGAPHRAEAFTAARELIDELKKRAPIWKKETGPDGTEWVGMGP